MQQYSLQQISIRYTLLVLCIIVALASISFILIKGLINSNYQEKQQQNIQIKANSISQIIKFYRRTVAEIAKGNNVIELLEFGSKDEAQLWAINMQKLIPDSVGITLFNEQGEILG